ncbi:hypothetical protein [Spongiactinospora sp. TRM90649]|uniref:hypothetical protein n=1 Tax=Spongiactinospora sp. TRM90649 TaxID=3031114 RepID=UPI0023F6EE0A|nr:hypothetical protein [Spongiactinospora sp. TRM90649]MDF5758697.1 hypothetical protein [Spongiactinospora sp. TRM90649]
MPAAFAARCRGVVVLKMGADGAAVGRGPYHACSRSPRGAGGRLRGGAVVAAALTTTGPGAVGPIPRREAVEARLAAPVAPG